MEKLLEEIYNMDSETMAECAKHVMVGGGTPGLPTVVRGKGVRLYDVDGKSFIDCTSQSWAMYLGYANDEMNETLCRHLQNITHVHQGVDTPMRYYLAKLLADISPEGFNRVSFTVGGGPAIEAAMKLCVKNSVQSREFICLYDSYHGTTLGTMGASWVSTRSAGKLLGGSRFLSLTRPFIRVPNPNCYRCFLNLQRGSCGLACARMLEMTLQRGVAGNAAGIIIEPIQASGGQIILPEEYLKEVRRICDEYNVPLVYDEIQTYCRIGEFFAGQYFGVHPDMIVLGKGLGAGLPIAGVMIHDRLKGFDSDCEELHTFANNSLSQVAAIKQIMMMKSGVLENAVKMGAHLKERLENLAVEFPEIGDVRQAGLHVGVEFVKDRRTKEPAADEADAIRKEMKERGVILGKAGPYNQILKIKPPLIINRAECDEILDILAGTLKSVLRK